MRHVVKPGAAVEPGPAATLNLRVRGFAGQSISPADVLQALAVVPNFHLAGLREIECACDEAWQVGAQVQAAYLQRERSIRFYRLAASMFGHILHHEIGHHVFALVIISKLKHLWVTRICAQSSIVTAYGSLSPEEDFAEAYALYLKPSRLGTESARGAPKLAFMCELVFSGDPWTLKETQSL